MAEPLQKSLHKMNPYAGNFQTYPFNLEKTLTDPQGPYQHNQEFKSRNLQMRKDVNPAKHEEVHPVTKKKASTRMKQTPARSTIFYRSSTITTPYMRPSTRRTKKTRMLTTTRRPKATRSSGSKVHSARQTTPRKRTPTAGAPVTCKFQILARNENVAKRLLSARGWLESSERKGQESRPITF